MPRGSARPSAARSNGHMAGHRQQQPGPGSPFSRSRACSSWDHALPAPPPGALDEDRRIPGTAPVPGTRSVYQGHHPHDEIRVPALARPPAAGAESGAGSADSRGHRRRRSPGHRTRRSLGRGRPGPARFSCPGAAGGSALKAGLRVYMCQAAWPVRGCPAVTAGLDAEGRPRTLARRVPRPERGSLSWKVSGGVAATFWSWRPGIRADRRPWRGIGARDLSHPQEQPLTSARSREPWPRPGPGGSWGHERLIGWRCL